MIRAALSARTVDACERAAGMVSGWLDRHPDDEVVIRYGSQVNRMISALRERPEEPR